MTIGKLVSVIIPTYKGAKELRRALNSVLAQTYNDIEIIVVDDNPPESEGRTETEQLMAQYRDKRVQYIKHTYNKNGAAARNTGIRASRGDYICFLDDDDFYMPERTEKSVTALENDECADVLFCGVVCTQGPYFEKISVEQTSPDSMERLLIDHSYIGSGSNIFLTRTAREDVVGFDESFRRHQDLEFMIRVLRTKKAIWIQDLLIVKATNNTNNMPDFDNFYQSKMDYLDKFKDEINALTLEEHKRCIDNHYSLLLKLSWVKRKDKRKIIIEELTKVRSLTLKEKMLCLLADIKIGNENIFIILKKRRKNPFAAGSDSVKMNIEDKTREFIEEQIGARGIHI